MLITDRFIQLMDVKIPQYWIIIMVNLEMVGRGKKKHRIFFLAGGSASLVGGRKERRKIGSFTPGRKRSHVYITYFYNGEVQHVGSLLTLHTGQKGKQCRYLFLSLNCLPICVLLVSVIPFFETMQIQRQMKELNRERVEHSVI